MTTKQSTITAQTTIKIRLPKALKERLQASAEQRNISLSSLLRLIATEYIKAKG